MCQALSQGKVDCENMILGNARTICQYLSPEWAECGEVTKYMELLEWVSFDPVYLKLHILEQDYGVKI